MTLATLTDTSVGDARTWGWCAPGAQTHWLFGMRWLPALGHQGQRALHRNLRQQGIAWVVNHGKRVPLVGVHSCAQPPADWRHCASAAAAYAVRHPEGAHALCLTVPDVGVWLVASLDGCLLSDTDRWFDSIEQAESFFQTIRQRHEQVQLEVRDWQPESAEATHAVPDFLQASAPKPCRFYKTSSGGATWQLVLVSLLCAGAALWVWGPAWLDGHTQPMIQAPEVPDPASHRVRVHDVASLDALLRVWHALPVDPAGWLLQGVKCRIEMDKGFCSAHYKRRKSDADNQGLLGQMPQGWTFEPESIDRALLKRTVSLPVRTLLAHMRVSRLFGLTQLQRLSPRVAEIALGAARRTMPSVAPAYRLADGTQGSVNPAPLLWSHPVSMRLALRRIDQLAGLSLPLVWRQADLVVVHNAQVDEQHGYLMLNIQGEWLETIE